MSFKRFLNFLFWVLACRSLIGRAFTGAAAPDAAPPCTATTRAILFYLEIRIILITMISDHRHCASLSTYFIRCYNWHDLERRNVPRPPWTWTPSTVVRLSDHPAKLYLGRYLSTDSDGVLNGSFVGSIMVVIYLFVWLNNNQHCGKFNFSL